VRYSNVGFLLLGQVVAAVSGRPLPDYVRAHILAPALARAPDLPPLGADDAPDPWADPVLGFSHPPAEVATGYTRRLSWAGLVVSALPDPQRLRVLEGGWVRYQPFHLNGAAYGGLIGNGAGWLRLLWALAQRQEALLSAEAYAAFFTPQPLSASGRSSGHALAWFVGYLGRHAYACHAGGGPGYYAEVRIYPGLGAASVLLTNSTGLRDRRRLDQLDAHWLP
jgi:CubicO group peptidase (beta-lactamase class C family)